jgi:tRNA(Arg) A34 adenosine deaminase TadA
MRRALMMAESAPHEKWRVGAVIVRGGAVLSTGYNRYRNSPSIVQLDGVSYHAEEAALRMVGNAEGATIYVARVTKTGLLSLARPCPKCVPKLKEAGIHSMVWTHPLGVSKDRL